MDPTKTRIYRTPDRKPLDFATTQVLRVVPGASGHGEYVALTPLAAAQKAKHMSKRELSKLQRLPPEVDELVREYNEYHARQANRFASTQKLSTLPRSRYARGRGRRWLLGGLLSVLLVVSALSALRQRRGARHARASSGKSPIGLANGAGWPLGGASRIPALGATTRRPPAETAPPRTAADPTAAPESAANRTVANGRSSRARSPQRKAALGKPSVVSPRMAADALAAGDVAHAAALYAALAAREPDNRAAAEAARILKARAGQQSAP